MIQLVGEFLAEYTRSFINTYGENSRYGGKSHILGQAEPNVDWEGGSFGNGTFWCCCTSGVWYMFQQALGIDITQYDFSYTASNNRNLDSSEYWESVSISSALPGDLLVATDLSHVELVLTSGATEHGNFGSYSSSNPESPSCKIHDSYSGESYVIFRLSSSVDVTPNGTLPSSSGTSSVNFSNFYFNGIPDGTYSVAHTSIWTLIVETLSQIADYLIGLLTYIIRIPFIGWAAIMDNLLNWTVQTITDTGTTSEDLGISSIEVEGADDEDRLTIDGLLYNDFDLTDINIFE